jgi:hypothetical protein
MVAWRKFFRRVDGFETHRGLRRRVVELEKSGRAAAFPRFFTFAAVGTIAYHKMRFFH